MTELEARLRRLSATTRQQLRVETSPASRLIRPVDNRRRSPLSYAQQRLWFLEQIEPGRPTYNIPVALRLDGPLAAEALQAALTTVIARHEVLRTSGAVVDGTAVQEIAPAGTHRLEIVDLTRLNAEAESSAVAPAMAGEAAAPFDLRHGPLLRARVLRLDGHTHVLLLTLHHIVSDGWSMDVLLREFSAEYVAALTGAPSGLPPPELRYADFAAWQREWLVGPVLGSEQVEYWRQQLAELDGLHFPSDRPRPSHPTRQTAAVPFTLDRELTDRLRVLSRQEGATLYIVLLAAFQVVLGRWAGQTDVALAPVVANRRLGELEPLIGLFVNTLALARRRTRSPCRAVRRPQSGARRRGPRHPQSRRRVWCRSTRPIRPSASRSWSKTRAFISSSHRRTQADPSRAQLRR
jgi:hypothetical protein